MAADLPPPPPAEVRLAPCPETPNCVSSQAPDRTHRVEPLPIEGSPEEALARLRGVIEKMPRTKVKTHSESRLEATFRSLVFRFVDDLVAVVDAEAGVIHVRSASRTGSSDLGVNRKRVETIRRHYLRPPPG